MGISASLFESAGVIVPSRRGYKPAKKKRSRPVEWWPLEVGSVLLSLDAASSKTGWGLILKTAREPKLIYSGVITAHGTDDVPKADDLVKQVYALATRTFSLNGVDYKATDAVVEISFGVSRGDPQGMSVYNMAVGGCAAACCLAGLEVHRMPVYAWKKGLMGGAKTRDAQKRRAKFLAEQFFRIKPIDDNHADALVQGYAHCMR